MIKSSVYAPPSFRQDELTAVFEGLSCGLSLDGWGMSRHRDYDVLVNVQRRMWVRHRNRNSWIEEPFTNNPSWPWGDEPY